MLVSKSTLSVFLTCFLIGFVSADLQEHLITAKPGGDVTLPCKAPNNAIIEIVKWTRSDLDRHVFLKIDGHLNTVDQDPSYVNRVQLKDDKMNNGELSLILKNVNNNDKGRYECRYKGEGGDVQMKLISIVILNAEEQTVKSGDDVTLHCQGPRDENIRLLKWIRSDLNIDEYVFFFRDGKIFKSFQHPSFHGRVQLKDPQMKNGDVSVILKNVNINDTGTYECQVSVSIKQSELMNIINLKVKDLGETAGNQTGGEKEEGKKDRNLGLKVGLPVVGILVAAVFVGFVFYKRHKGRSDQPVHYTAADPQQD